MQPADTQYFTYLHAINTHNTSCCTSTNSKNAYTNAVHAYMSHLYPARHSVINTCRIYISMFIYIAVATLHSLMKEINQKPSRDGRRYVACDLEPVHILPAPIDIRCMLKPVCLQQVCLRSKVL